MNKMLLRLFQKNVLYQCEYVIVAWHGLEAGLQANDGVAIFRELQNLLNAAANVSKLLWGQAGKYTKKRKAIRESIDVPDDSPLRVVTMRNNFEHFDERLDKWWRESKQHNSVDFTVSAPGGIVGFAPIDMFRMYDPAAGNLYFWGQEFNVGEIVREVIRILPKLQEEARKRHWDDPPEETAAASDTDPHAATADEGHNAPHDS